MITNGWTSVGTAATAIDGVHNNPVRMTIHNNDNSTNIYLGGTGVTTTNGLLLLKEQRSNKTKDLSNLGRQSRDQARGSLARD